MLIGDSQTCGCAPFWTEREGSRWLMIHSLKVAVRIHPGAEVSPSAALRKSDMCGPGLLPCRNNNKFLHGGKMFG